MNSVRDAWTRWRAAGDEKENEMSEQDTMQHEVGGTEQDAKDGAQIEVDAGSEPQVLDVEAGNAELDQARGERDALRERLARLQAEFDNARKREAKEKQDARDYATQAAVEPFLGVLDNFALALKAEGSVEQLRLGVGLIVKQMEEALRGLNVQAVESVGAEFDPRVHEALGSEETAEFPDHHVMEEIRRGYKLREKLLRPALVKIAVNPQQRSE